MSDVSGGQAAGKRLALVIGVDSTCSSILPVLKHAVADAQEVADVLVQRCQFTLHVPPLLDEQATSASIKRAVLELVRQRSADDFLLLYFSGHGQQAYDELRQEIRHTYLGSADFKEEEVEEDPTLHVSLHWLRERLFEKTDAGRVLVILDCCYGEDIRTGSDHTLDELRRQLQHYFEIPGAEVKKRRAGLFAALAAAGYDKIAGEETGHGTMTRLLLKALRGKEPAVVGAQGQISLNRLLDYINTEMPSEQKPVISYTNSSGLECVLVTYPELARRPSRALVAERPSSYLPFRRNTLFQTRPGEFEDLEAMLLPSGTTQPLHAGLVGVTGMGGIGKTQLAVEFAYRYQERFPGGIFWMPANGHTLFDWQRSFAELAANADYLPTDDDISHPENERRRARHLCRYLAQHSDALLILDNVEKPELVTSALPTLAGSDVCCAIFYTSRVTSAPYDIRLHRVERLPEDAALRLLLETTRPQTLAAIAAGEENTETRAARQVCERVGYLPLALVHLRGRLAQDGQTTLALMAEVLRQGKLASLKQVLFETFRWSWERVHDEAAQRLFLLACSFPEATPVPLWLLGLAAGLGEQAESFEPLGEACLELQSANLFERLSGEQVRLHPLVREFGQDLIAALDDRGTKLVTEAIEHLAGAFVDLNAVERRMQQEGYWGCLEQVRAARDYTLLLHEDEAAPLVRIERWMDRESYLLTDEARWRKRLPGLLYQQLANHAVEEGVVLRMGEAPAQWLQQKNRVGAEDQALLRIFAGHKNRVTSVAFSPDGRYVLTGSYDGTAHLWETFSGQPLASYKGHTDLVRSVAFSPDGRYVLTGSYDGTAHLWETSSGQQLMCYQGHAREVSSVAFSPDGRYVLTGSYDGTAHLWETSSGQQLMCYQGHARKVSSVAFSPDGRYMLTGSDDDTARLWETSSGQQLMCYQGHASRVNSVAFSPDGCYVLTGSYDDTARLWETSSGQQLMCYQGHASRVNSVAFSPDGRYVLTGSGDRTARLWEASSGQQLMSYQGHARGVSNVAFSPDGRYVLTGSDDRIVRLWMSITIQPLTSYQGHADSVRSVAFSPDGRYVLTGSGNRTARLWETSSGQRLVTYQGHTDSVRSVAFSPDGRYVLTGSDDDTAWLWETSSGQQLMSYQGHARKVSSVAFSPDGRYVLTGSGDCTARLWEASSGQQLMSYQGHARGVSSVAFSPDGRYVLTGSDDRTARLWETSSGQLLASYRGHKSRLTGVAFSPDGRYVLTGSGNRTARLLKTSSGQRLVTYQGHTDSVHTVAFSPDGRLLVTCDGNGRVLFWRAPAAGQQKERLLGMYIASYPVEAVYWQDSTTIVLADRGNANGRPNIYYLKLHGME